MELEYSSAYLASVSSVFVLLALSLKKHRRLYTFDDGTANLSPSSSYAETYELSVKKYLALKLFGNKYSSRNHRLADRWSGLWRDVFHGDKLHILLQAYLAAFLGHFRFRSGKRPAAASLCQNLGYFRRRVSLLHFHGSAFFSHVVGCTGLSPHAMVISQVSPHPFQRKRENRGGSFRA